MCVCVGGERERETEREDRERESYRTIEREREYALGRIQDVPMDDLSVLHQRRRSTTRERGVSTRSPCEALVDRVGQKKRREDERIAELSRPYGRGRLQRKEAEKNEKKEALIARENRKHRERWGLWKILQVTTTSSQERPRDITRKRENQNLNSRQISPFEFSGGMLD